MEITTILFERVNAELVRMVVFESEAGHSERSVKDIAEASSNAALARLAVWEAENADSSVVFLAARGNDLISLNEVDTGRAKKLQTKLIRMLEQI
jgi:hypothetical protein